MKDKLERDVKKLLKAGIIRESHSPNNIPVWIVPKPNDEDGRMVLDLRESNEKTIADSYPLPSVTQIDQVGKAKYYTVCYPASEFHQLKMNPKDCYKVAFITLSGHYQFVRMPFDLKNAPATIQRLMDCILKGLQGIEMSVYLHDIVIYADSIE